jgi:hypothetical protein
VNDRQVAPTTLTTGETEHPIRVPEASAAMPPRPDGARDPSSGTIGRITAIVIGTLLTLVSVVLLGAGGTVLWADLTQRDGGYVTTDVRRFSTSGAALTTRPTDLGPAGIAWLYSPSLLDDVRIRVTPSDVGRPLFVGIGPSTEVDRYLEGVRHTLISDFWGSTVRAIGGGSAVSAPDTQDFWVASDTGSGPRTVTWDLAEGSWTVVVMNADGRPGIGVVATDLGATVPALVWVAIGVLVAGGVFLVGGVLLMARATQRRSASSRTR